MRWEIRAGLGPWAREEADARGWLWEIARGDRVAPVVVEVTATAWSSDPRRLPEDTRQALETDGRAELLKVLDRDDPPGVIRCGSEGCTYISAGKAGSAGGRAASSAHEPRSGGRAPA